MSIAPVPKPDMRKPKPCAPTCSALRASSGTMTLWLMIKRLTHSRTLRTRRTRGVSRA